MVERLKRELQVHSSLKNKNNSNRYTKVKIIAYNTTKALELEVLTMYHLQWQQVLTLLTIAIKTHIVIIMTMLIV